MWPQINAKKLEMPRVIRAYSRGFAALLSLICVLLRSSAADGLFAAQLFQQVVVDALLVISADLRAAARQIEHVDGHFAFGIDQSNLAIAFLVRQPRADALQQSGATLGNHLQHA